MLPPGLRERYYFRRSVSELIANAPKPGQCDKATDYFLKAQLEMKSLPEAKAAGEAYRFAELAIEEVKGHIDRLRLAVRFPTGSVCDGCLELVR